MLSKKDLKKPSAHCFDFIKIKQHSFLLGCVSTHIEVKRSVNLDEPGTLQILPQINNSMLADFSSKKLNFPMTFYIAGYQPFSCSRASSCLSKLR